MEQNKSTNKRKTSLAEIICAIGIFTVCCIVIVQLFAGARYTSTCAQDENDAIFKAEEIVEKIKTDTDFTSGVIANGFTDVNGVFTLFLDKNWEPTTAKDAAFSMEMQMSRQMSGVDEGTLICKRVAPYPFLKAERQTLCELQIARYNGGGINE